MGGNSSKSAPPKRAQQHISAQDRAVLDLKSQRDKLKMYQKKIETIADREKQCAKEALKKGDKQKAKLFLQKRKYQEKLLVKADTQLQNIEEMVQTIEWKVQEKEVFDQLTLGKDALQEINKQISIDDVDRLMDDTREAIEYQEEISRALGAKLTEEDDADVLAELDELVGIENDTEALDVKQKLPEVPNTQLETATETTTEVAQEKKAAVEDAVLA
eukprot:Clim_evm17s150 gene=Clim_evmTU17s150